MTDFQDLSSLIIDNELLNSEMTSTEVPDTESVSRTAPPQLELCQERLPSSTSLKSDSVAVATGDARSLIAAKPEAKGKVTGPCLLVDPQPQAPHNDLIPIARLPPEILNTIFTILCSIDRPKRRKTSQYHPGWLSITYVCQRWRHIALHQPTLWASSIVIPFAFGSRWADAFLSRSQGTPLAIHRPQVVQRLSLTPAELMVINENLARIRILCLTTTDAVLPTLCAPAPLLHTLDLSFFRQYMAPPVQPPLPDGLLGGRTGAPELRHLRVTSYGTLPWTSPLLAQLVSLEVVLQGNVPAHNGECAAVLDALRGMHVLERLVLLGFELGIATERPVVTLAALRYLELSANTESACYLLTHIALPGARVQCNMLSPADPVELVNALRVAGRTRACVQAAMHHGRRYCGARALHLASDTRGFLTWAAHPRYERRQLQRIRDLGNYQAGRCAGAASGKARSRRTCAEGARRGGVRRRDQRVCAQGAG
ncbi:hypothetical protein FA95DRAFT_1681955 [Auriscalpium vulgare]|uniref:Uncharacterized protein n=1 Tax=Auriscalpium vulgare TaxID=40419 RepID=A0ACB8RGV5_9AGAM|nr:hypothetical protein FA95DRAFT_1681955 [Auriscalpium vulgare]